MCMYKSENSAKKRSDNKLSGLPYESRLLIHSVITALHDKKKDESYAMLNRSKNTGKILDLYNILLCYCKMLGQNDKTQDFNDLTNTMHKLSLQHFL